MVLDAQHINPETLWQRLEAAADRRIDLPQREATNVYRLVHGFGDQLPGMNLDWANGLAVVWEMQPGRYDLATVTRWLNERFSPMAVIHKGRALGRSGGAVLSGVLRDPEWLVEEQGLTFALEPLAAQNLGLFLDARPVRRWLMDHSQGRLVLNTFAYTGSLGVAARAGGAQGCIQVDLQAAQLERARRNHALNGQRIDDRDLMKADVLRWLRKRRRLAGGIILDPPPRLPGKRRKDPQAWNLLVSSAAPLLEPGGWLLALLNRRGVDQAQWEAQVIETASAQGVEFVPFWRATSGDDFHEPNQDARLRVSAFRRVDQTD